MARKIDRDRLELIANIEHLQLLAKARRSVYVSWTGAVMPAAVVLNWQAGYLLSSIGSLYIYPRKRRQK